MNESTQQYFAAGLAGLGMLAAALAASITTWSLRPRLLRPSRVLDNDLIVRWAQTRGEVRLTTEIPSNARLVSLLDRVSTPLVPSANRQTTPGGAEVYFQAVKTLLGESGRGDEDRRCVGLLLAIESAWGHIAWNNNIANVKSQGSIYAHSIEEIVTSRQVWTTNAEAEGVYLLVDRINSLDGYHAYGSPAVYMRRMKMLLERVYPGVIPAWQAGGLEGLLDGERILGGDSRSGVRYSPAFAIQRIATARWYWWRWSRMMGANWTR